MKTSNLLYWALIKLCKTKIWKPLTCFIGMQFTCAKLSYENLKVVVLEWNLVVQN